jgi:hypothetical protein
VDLRSRALDTSSWRTAVPDPSVDEGPMYGGKLSSRGLLRAWHKKKSGKSRKNWRENVQEDPRVSPERCGHAMEAVPNGRNYTSGKLHVVGEELGNAVLDLTCRHAHTSHVRKTCTFNKKNWRKSRQGRNFSTYVHPCTDQGRYIHDTQPGLRASAEFMAEQSMCASSLVCMHVSQV